MSVHNSDMLRWWVRADGCNIYGEPRYMSKLRGKWIERIPDTIMIVWELPILQRVPFYDDDFDVCRNRWIIRHSNRLAITIRWLRTEWGAYVHSIVQ
jgi:hypothetical protein